ncbi:MAG: hypothetical protein KH452_05320 [Clostridiales bacterium]|nr:hypothetical protein [Clostridiales bacterium]
MEKEIQELDGQKKKYVLAGLVAVILIAAVVIAVLLTGNDRRDAVLRSPTGILYGSDGNLYLTDQGGNSILRMDEGNVKLIAGYMLPADIYGDAIGSYGDGTWDKAFFNAPFDLEEWGGGLAVSDTGNNCIRLAASDGIVRTLAGTTVQGCQNGMAYEATFYEPKGIAAGPDGSLYIADSGNGVIRRLSEDGQVETVVGDMDTPVGLSWDGDVLYITDAGTSQILKYENGELSVVAGAAYTDEERSLLDGDAQNAVFSAPQGILAQDGMIYVADTGFSAIRRIKDGQVDTISIFEGTGSNLWPAGPTGMEMKAGNLLIADPYSGVIFEVKDPDETQADENYHEFQLNFYKKIY